MSKTDLIVLLGPIRKHLLEVEKVIAKEINRSEFGNINQISRYVAIQKGKRLRPILILATARALGSVTQRHIQYAAICELLHTATLLHDDVMDEAQVRRHRKSVNVRWGNTVSILLGDYLLARSSMLLSKMNSPILSKKLTHTAKDICEGELLQVLMSRNVKLSDKNYLKMIRKKTASLFSICCWGSAMISGAKNAMLKAFFRYGEALGMAFQITDDVIDLIGSDRIEGKTLGTDLMKGKMTLPLIYLRKHLNQKQRIFLRRFIHGRSGPASVEHIKRLLDENSCIEKVMDENHRYVQRALKQLAGHQENRKMDLLFMLPQYVVSRIERKS